MRNFMLHRVALLAIAGTVTTVALSLAQGSAHGQAQAYPSRVIQIIVPSAAGTPPDVRARELAEIVARALGKPIIIVNKPGAGGGIGLQAAARSPADGHTLVFCTDAPLTINKSVYEALPYDPMTDFAPIMVAHGLPLVLVVHAEVPARSLSDLIQLAKAQPDALFYGSAGNGTPPHILADLFKFMAGLDMVHVPYKGGPAATMALIGREVVFTIDAPSQVLPHIKTGKLRALAVTGTKRLAVLPDVPTFAEAGVSGMNASWSAFLAPAGTPKDIVQRLNREFARALHSETLQAFYKTIGVEVVASSPDELTRRIVEETPKWRETVKRAGITPG